MILDGLRIPAIHPFPALMLVGVGSLGLPYFRVAEADRPGERAIPDTADSADIRATLQGDGEAYERLVRRYQQRVAGWMWRFTRDQGLVEELAQDVFVEAWSGLHGYRSEAPFEHWLRTIATRVGYRHWKSLARQRRIIALPVDEVFIPAERSDLTPRQAGELLHALLAALPPRDRLVLTLIHLDECSVAEAAALTGWSRTMVKVQAHRARRKLERLLAEKELEKKS